VFDACQSGIGHARAGLLAQMGIDTVEQLQQQSLPTLHTRFGARVGSMLFDLARGVDKAPVKTAGERAHILSFGQCHNRWSITCVCVRVCV